MRTIYIDCAGVETVDEFWRRYVEATQPEGAHLFGRNLDAFWDAVEGGGPGWPGEVKLAFSNTDALITLRLRDGASLLDGLRRVANEVTQMEIEIT